MGFSCEDYLDDDEKQSKGAVVDECNMLHHLDHGVECESTMVFWPVEHPEEPSDEDRAPVKCPMPDDSSSVTNNEKIYEEEPFKELSSRMKLPPEEPNSVRNNKEEAKAIAVTTGETPARQMRKRHHTLTRMDSPQLSPLIRILPPHLPSSARTRNITIFEMLQQFDKFD